MDVCRMDYCTLWSFLEPSSVSPHSLLLYGKEHCKHIKEVIHTGFEQQADDSFITFSFLYKLFIQISCKCT